MMNPSYVKITDHKNGIVQLTLNQAAIHNAFDEHLISELTSTLRSLDADRSVRVIILDANGKSFSAGADLNWMRRMADYSYAENHRDSQHLAALMATLFNIKCPTIAAVQGAAIGGGVGLVACCDIAIASEKASFCLSEVKLGLIPAVISPYVVKAMGERAAKRYFITAERFTAQTAQQLGLISEIVAAEALNSTVMSVAQLIISNAPGAVIAAKQLIGEVAARPIDEQLQAMTASRIAEIRASAEGKEGITAFLEKRQPIWKTE